MLEQLLNIQMGEFEALKKEQEGRRVTRDNLGYFTLLTLGGVLLGVERTGQQLFLLGAWFGCMVLGWTRLANDMKVHQIRMYIRDDLSEKIREILKAMSADPLNSVHREQVEKLLASVLAWESASLNGRSWRRIGHLTADMVLFVVPTMAAPFLASGALDQVMGTGPAAVVVVALLVAAAPLAWGILVNSR